MTGATATKPSVLIIDDETGILETLRILLKNEGFTPHVALGGKQGLEQIEALAPDIVISDVRMPSVGGLDILATVRTRDPDVPVILMTAQADLRSAIQAVNEGAYHYIQKPFVNDEIVAVLRRAAEHRQLRMENKTLRREIRRRDRDGAVALRVTDNGPGIPAEIRDRVFDPFFTTKPGGTGLGLPIVHRAIEAHRGVMLVDSGAGGTSFTVLLPRWQPKNGESE